MQVKYRWRAIIMCVAAQGAAMPAIAAPQSEDLADRGPTEIKRCQTVDQPGSYKLVKNLKAVGDCLVITAEGVTIDLGGFALTGDGTGTAIKGPKAQTGTIPQARTVVRNGDISSFAQATNLSGTVEGLRVTSNREGIVVGVGTVRGNTVQFNASAGIELADGIVAGNLVIANGTGISVQEAAVITGNEVLGNKIGIDASGTGSSLTANVVDDNKEIGMRIHCPSNLTSNTAVGNGTNLVLSDTTCLTSGNLAP